MRKIAFAFILLGFVAALAAPAAEAAARDRLRLNIVVLDGRDRGVDIRLTLPLRVVEAVVRDGNATIRVRKSGCRVDFREVLAELKRGRGRDVVEFRSDGKIFKAWVD
ncbi:MAG: hypothetical protein FJY80_04040 [Candidatus Aminicenantes bacterium]|nr:hypothetical protein [Candidatus Aminicenantes bacterium]